jgi:hypothetical protein
LRVRHREAYCADEAIAAMERRCGPAQDLDRFGQCAVDIIAPTDGLRAEVERIRQAAPAMSPSSRRQSGAITKSG